MATGQYLNLVDLTTRLDSGGNQLPVAEMLSQSNDMIDDIPMMEGNQVFSHEVSLRTSLPSGYWRIANSGVPLGKSTTNKATFSMATLEVYSQVDKLIASAAKDLNSFRATEDRAFVMGLGQTMVQGIFYGNLVANPAQFFGLSSFYNTLNPALASNAPALSSAGGTGTSNASIWLIGFGEGAIYGAYPMNTTAGLMVEDKGDIRPGYDSAGNQFEVYTSWFCWRMSLIVHDWRQAARLCNIDVTAAGLAGPNAYDLWSGMAALTMKIPNLGKASAITKTDDPTNFSGNNKSAFYMNRTTRYWADIQGMRNKNVFQTINDAAGKPQDMFRNIPIKVVDQLLTTEATVV